MPDSLTMASANAPAVQKVEDFRTFAFPELEAVPFWVPGICFLPECSAAFEPTRDWQIHCSDVCRRKSEAEFRKWGYRLATSALVWRMFRYKRDAAGKALSRKAWQHVGQVQSAWFQDRNVRTFEGLQHA